MSVLSQYYTNGNLARGTTLSSIKNLRYHTASLETSKVAMYSVFVIESVVETCLTIRQLAARLASEHVVGGRSSELYHLGQDGNMHTYNPEAQVDHQRKNIVPHTFEVL